MTDENNSGGVTIGDVSGGIHSSIIAGRDVTNATITIGGEPTPADKDPSVDELTQLLAEIQADLAALTAQQEALKDVSPAAPLTAQGAEQSVKAAADAVEPEMQPEDATSVKERLEESVGLLSGILDGAKTIIQKTEATAEAVEPIASRLEPLVQKLAVAALWTSKLWLHG